MILVFVNGEAIQVTLQDVVVGIISLQSPSYFLLNYLIIMTGSAEETI